MREVPTPLSLLKKELDGVHAALSNLNQDVLSLENKIDSLEESRTSLKMVASAIEREMDRIRQLPEQLELDLNDDE